MHPGFRLSKVGSATPFPLTLNPALYLHSTSVYCRVGGAPATNGQVPDTWLDATSNGNDFTIPIGLLGFTFTDIGSGRFCMRSNGSGQRMSRTTVTQQLGPGSTWTVMAFGSERNATHNVLSRVDGVSPQWRACNLGGNARTVHFNRATLAVTNTYNTRRLATYGYDGTDYFFTLSGGTYTKLGVLPPLFTTSTAPIEIGSSDAGFNPIDYDLEVVAFYPSAISQSDNALCNAYFLSL